VLVVSVYALSFLHTGTVDSVYNNLHLIKSGKYFIVKPLNLLPSNAKSIPVHERVYRDRLTIEQLIHKYKLNLNLDNVTALQEFKIDNHEILVLITKNGLNNNSLIALDASTGKRLKVRVIMLRKFTRIKVMLINESINDYLNVIGTTFPTDILEKVTEVYISLKAIKKFNAISYKLQVYLPDVGYTALGYYVRATYKYEWYLFNHLVFGVYADGLFYVNPEKSVNLVADYPHYKVNPPFTKCKFSHSTTSSSVAVSLRADGEAALLDCLVTTKVSAWAVVAVDKYGNVFKNGGGNKWVAIGCGCWAPP